MTPETLAAFRFGFGPGHRPSAAGPEALLEGLKGADLVLSLHPAQSTSTGFALDNAEMLATRAFRRAERASGEAPETQDLKTAFRAARARRQRHYDLTCAQWIGRALDTAQPLRERLVWFFTDHFTTFVRGRQRQALMGGFIDAAIRPHVTGRFDEILWAALTHPMMLAYLDQTSSVGPDSQIAQANPARGLNENLARELLELHTLGVGGAYTQADVRELAELLTGLTYNHGRGFFFNPRMAEPGAETVLGERYGTEDRALEDIRRLTQRLAAHPDTAGHLARKLAVHFVGPAPDPSLISTIARVWQRTGGDIARSVTALLTHPSARAGALQKARQPADFIAAALSALDVPGSALREMLGDDQGRGPFRKTFDAPLAAMGQPFFRPRGPDGWSEDPAAWITPARLAARMDWAAQAPGRLLNDALPDPRAFLDRALADAAPAVLRRATAAAQDRREGVALVLASPAFNRR